MDKDTLLVRRAASGDADAFETLVSGHLNRVYALCLRMTGSRQDAQDLAQEVLLRVYRSLPTFRSEADFGTWLYRISVNRCIDFLRSRGRAEILSMEALREMGYEPPDAAPSPEGSLLQSEQAEQIRQAILLLPAEQRAAVILRDVQGFSYEEVSSALQLNMNTVKSRISRGRQRLREILLEVRNKSETVSSNL